MHKGGQRGEEKATGGVEGRTRQNGGTPAWTAEERSRSLLPICSHLRLGTEPLLDTPKGGGPLANFWAPSIPSERKPTAADAGWDEQTNGKEQTKTVCSPSALVP